MPNFFTASIDVTKVEKARLVPTKKPGNNAKYLELALIPLRTPDQYGN